MATPVANQIIRFAEKNTAHAAVRAKVSRTFSRFEIRSDPSSLRPLRDHPYFRADDGTQPRSTLR